MNTSGSQTQINTRSNPLNDITNKIKKVNFKNTMNDFYKINNNKNDKQVSSDVQKLNKEIKQLNIQQNKMLLKPSLNELVGIDNHNQNGKIDMQMR